MYLIYCIDLDAIAAFKDALGPVLLISSAYSRLFLLWIKRLGREADLCILSSAENVCDCKGWSQPNFVVHAPVRANALLTLSSKYENYGLFGCEAVSLADTYCCQLGGFYFSPSDRLVASSAVRIHYTSCQSDENRTHVPLFNIHMLNEWRQLSLWNLDEGRELRNAHRQIDSTSSA